MLCPNCGHPKTEVDPHTERNRKKGIVVYRTRVCPECLESFTTMEKPEYESNKNDSIYGLMVSSTETYETVVFRKRVDKLPPGIPDVLIRTIEEIMPEQLCRYKKNGREVKIPRRQMIFDVFR